MNARIVRAAIAAAALGLVVSGFAGHASAGSAYWHGVRSDVWSDGIAAGFSNWYSEAPPNGVARNVPSGTAIFAKGALRTSIRITNNATVGRMRFTSDAPRYVFRILRARKLVVNGFGLVNLSNTSPQFVVLPSAQLIFRQKAHLISGGATSADISVADFGVLGFLNQSGGGNATVIARGQGSTVFADTSSAEHMTIRNRNGGAIEFFNRSTGGDARLENQRTGLIRFIGTGPAGDGVIPVGTIVNNGRIDLGGRTLRVRRGFNQGPAGAIFIGVKSGRRFGRVDVTAGAVNLNGALVVDANGTTRPGNYKIVLARRGVRSGKFSKLTLRGRNDLKARLAYSRKEVTLIIERK